MPVAGSQAYQINLEQLNDFGATGTAMVSLEGTKLTVKIQTEGLTPGAPHAQHIHGSTKGMDFHCPDPSADKNGDGIVSTVEGLPTYGDINISLTTSGDTGKSELDPKLPLEATAPASCGMVHGASIGEMPEGGVETGTAATGDDSHQMMALGGAGLMAAAVGAVVVWRRAGER